MPFSFSISSSDPAPLHAQLQRSIRFAIATGRLGPGDQLPTVRQLAVDLRIDANTVAKAYAGLEEEGIVRRKRGAGTFVERRVQKQQITGGPEDLEDAIESFLLEVARLGFDLEDVLSLLRRRQREQKRHEK